MLNRQLGALSAVLAGLVVVTLPGRANAANIFVESGGVAAAEAENFSARNNTGSTKSFAIVPDEGAQSGTYSGTLSGKAVQVLPDVGGSPVGTVPDVTPAVDYVFRINTTGTYRLHLKGGGFNGNSDSLYAQVVGLKDGTGGSFVDYYSMALNGGTSGVGNYDAWNSKGASEAGTASTAAFVDYPIATPGDYTVRLTMREDGALLDKVVFQLSSLTAPTGAGPAESQIVPEPAALSLLAAVPLMLLLRRRRSVSVI